MENNNKKDETEYKKYFVEEEKELNEAIKDINDLYNEIKGHFDQVKNASRSAAGGRGVLNFVQLQTKNLVSLKDSKASLINNKIMLKKYEYELNLKEKKDKDESAVNNEIINAVLEKLDSTSVIEEDYVEETIDESLSPDEILERRLKEIEANDNKESLDEQPKEVKEEDGIVAIAINGKKWKFVGIDEYGKIIKGYKVPDKKQFKMKLKKKKDGTYYAVDQDGKIYMVIGK